MLHPGHLCDLIVGKGRLVPSVLGVEAGRALILEVPRGPINLGGFCVSRTRVLSQDENELHGQVSAGLVTLSNNNVKTKG